MNSFYTNEMRQFFHTRDWPMSLRWEIVEFDDCLKLRLYRDNINRLNSDEKLHLASLVNQTLSAVRKTGVPIYVWVAPGDGRRNDVKQ